jgi:chromosome segregation ATPase
LNFQLEETNKIKDSLSKFEEDKEILQSEITVLKSSANQNEETMKELLSTVEEKSSLEKEVVEKSSIIEELNLTSISCFSLVNCSH